MWSRKRSLLHGYEYEAPPHKKKCSASLKTALDRCERAAHHVRLKSCGHSCPHDACVIADNKHLINNKQIFEQISCWADPQNSVKKVMELLKSRQAPSDIYLDNAVNKKFLELRGDITEECGAEDKQHSWAIIEKQEEIIMYGPYYPNYSNGEHSEDTVIKQTQELLESEVVSEDWKVYVFTMNSPCLTRNTDPCMLNLVRKAQEWWTLYRVKTHIGFVRCWGFKGNKENVFRDINYQQVDCINQTEDHEGFVNAAEKKTDLNPVCETQYYAAKHLLQSGQLNFPLTTVQEQDCKSYFKNMHSIVEDKPEEEKNIFKQEVNTMIQAAQAELPEKKGSFEEHLETGRKFALNYTFSQQVCDPLQEQLRVMFQQCWREMVQDKYAEFIREKLTEEFNRCTVELFIKDIVKFTKEYLHIGRIRFKLLSD
ncbi:uncharacterized protein LOC113148872 isoform X2 [Anabas testudineus]|uniref:uncharacterized protein LOC113148872 isoform X2 n=1 Tax=Anabas testudineus TaxID=64144 RepID=UPI000E45DFF1|nr:uncharacterized protein LOC113148872 isoform X2 [Anabas testudineus]